MFDFKMQNQLSIEGAKTPERAMKKSSKNSIRVYVELFIQNTSLRGFGKLYKTRFCVLKTLWFVYVVSMVILLSMSSYNLCKEYFEYHTSLQTEEKLNDKTVFPGITICSLKPFSQKAQVYWKNGQGLSPIAFSKRLKQGIAKFLKEEKYADAQSLFQNDKITTYFQNINGSEVEKYGHNETDMIPYCLMRHSSNANPYVAHEEECAVTVRRIDNPYYFNCFDMDISPEDSVFVSSISLILSTTIHNLDETDYNEVNGTFTEAENITTHNIINNQIFNVFNEQSGFKIFLHETGNYPSMSDGFNIQMKTATSINYITSHIKKTSLPNEPCSNTETYNFPKIIDNKDNNNKTEFTYTYDACMSANVGKYIMDQCKCISAFHIRPQSPSPKMPYCNYFDPENPDDFVSKTNCIRKMKTTEIMTRLDTEVCKKRCNFHSYDGHMSVSNWNPTLWQLHWMGHLSESFRVVTQTKNKSSSDFTKHLQHLLNYTKHSYSAADNLGTKLVEDDVLANMALVTITRSSYNTLVQREQLQITKSALMSRLGGIGSLTLGVTLTFIFEIFEFFFLLGNLIKCRLLSSTKKTKDNNNTSSLSEQMDPLLTTPPETEKMELNNTNNCNSNNISVPFSPIKKTRSFPGENPFNLAASKSCNV